MGVKVYQGGHQHGNMIGVTGPQEPVAVNKRTRLPSRIIQPLVIEDIIGETGVPGQYVPDKAVLHHHRAPQIRVFINNTEIV
jgi:hypothetical protein